MVFFSQKVLRKVPGNWTFLVVLTATSLDSQIYQYFANAARWVSRRRASVPAVAITCASSSRKTTATSSL